MRYPSIDILRTVAIAVMVLVHFAENLAGVGLPIAGMGAPLFAFLSGVSYYLWSDSRRAKGTSDREISRISVRRGLFVFGVGIAYNILVWLPEDTFNWDVLTFIGVALLLLNSMRGLPVQVPIMIAVMSLWISPVLREMVEYDAYWVNRYFDYEWTLSDVCIGFLSTGYFPIFPWLSFSLAGFVTARWLFDRIPEKTSDGVTVPSSEATFSLWPMVGVGAGMLATSLLALLSRPYLNDDISERLIEGWSMFPPSIPYVLGMLGVILILFAAVHQYVDRNATFRSHTHFLEITRRFSQYSFSLYILHHLAHVWPLWIYGLANGQETTYYWRQAMPVANALVLAVIFLLVCYVVLSKLSNVRNYGMEASMRWLCD
ncbi:Protein of unknown function [Neorhodopirellula lusitana]|uniref:Heparan-alpha-glucosaminide N-acetyltransferase catalytic domain-containing protein n=1 Tax=Neorhodopirellula lusitana TaxID=445327 RepID=A0ABY1Q409_9BACT|nr:heparan-alpha-glucosaminide N-acetyltransferase domain-containing protein [Neorhodopirellula lusitana]SMP56793.1 Protein of unknown function [Neorhodopirellula lusitana]